MKKNEFLKLIALISMIVDHTGAVFFPELLFLRIIGRIAFPIYAHSIACGYIYTRNVYKYMIRLLICGIISQVPYYLLFGNNLNILFTLLYGLVVIYLYDNVNKLIGICFLIISLYISNLDYGFYGVCSIFLFYLLNEKVFGSIFFQSLLTIIKVCFLKGHYIQLYCVVALPLIYYFWNDKCNIRLSINKYMFYFSYPAHLCILFAIKLYFEGI